VLIEIAFFGKWIAQPKSVWCLTTAV